jgi:magnesium-transporting ATPase (P-type)
MRRTFVNFRRADRQRHRPFDDGAGAASLVRLASRPAEDVLASVGTSREGLSAAEAAVRRARFGPNLLPRCPRHPWYFELGANLFHLLALLLWAAAALSWMLGTPEVAAAIVAVIAINGLFSFWQEYQAGRAAEALQDLLPHQVTVRRAKREQAIPAADVVPGDILILTEGEAVPADARVIAADGLRLDTSSLTGESRPMPRFAHPVPAGDRAPAVLANLVFAGTSVAGGRGEAVVFAIGGATEFGRIARLVQTLPERPSPLEREVAQVTRVISALAIGMGIIFYLVGTLVGGLPPLTGLLFAIGMIVANVPEGLLPTLTLALAIAVRQLATRNALVKRLSAVEALGATTTIVTDKTGTLTENEMTVREAWAGGRGYRMSGAGYEPVGAAEAIGAADPDPAILRELLRTAALCCDAQLVPPDHDGGRWSALGDPTEAAILAAAAKIGVGREALEALPRLAELPFDSVRKRMTTIQEIDGVAVACVKGALSELLPHCTKIIWDGSPATLDDRPRQAVRDAHDQLTGRGMRVLAVAARSLDPQLRNDHEWRAEEVETGLVLLGLIAMEDPPRPEVPDAIAACRQAGIRVIMVTGDDGRTAAAIGREIGLIDAQCTIVTGADLEVMSEVALDAALDRSDVVFARVVPDHKLRLVRALQRRNEVVAVTGDGVNDAPALKQADIGVAMGATGTDVARETADMVLTDDNFAAIVSAIELGRGVYDNVRKFLTYVLTHNVPEAAAFVAFALLRIPLPLTVLQVLAIDLGTDILPALALGMEPPEAGIMKQPPRSRSERLLDRATIMRVYLWLGPLESVLVLGGYLFAMWSGGWRPGAPMPAAGPTYLAATTMSLAGIVACQSGNVLSCRSPTQPVWRMGIATNRTALAGIAVGLGLLLILIHVPALARLFDLEPLGLRQWIVLACFGPLLIAFEEVRKAIGRRLRPPLNDHPAR